MENQADDDTEAASAAAAFRNGEAPWCAHTAAEAREEQQQSSVIMLVWCLGHLSSGVEGSRIQKVQYRP